jgi:hypothetical protein
MDSLIEQIQSCGLKASIVMTGGGTTAISEILTHPGASRFVVEAYVPYSPAAFDQYLEPTGQNPESYCSASAAVLLAKHAYTRASNLEKELPVIGFSCTAALQTNRVRRGTDRAYFSWCQKGVADVVKNPIPVGSRKGQEHQVSVAFLNFMLKICRELTNG